MTEITAHVMIRNEEYWIGHVLIPLFEVLDHVIIIDTGSEDNTIKIVRDVVNRYPGKSTVLLYSKLDPTTNGAVRQWMTEKTQTEWAMIVDGDEYYPIDILERIKRHAPPSNGRLGFTTLQVLQHHNGEFARAELWNKQALFHVPTTQWSGDYPYEGPNWYSHPETFFYYDADIIGCDFHHLARSSADSKTYHRHDSIRQMQPTAGQFLLPLDLYLWPNPYQEAYHDIANAG